MTSASTMVETVSKSSVQYVHQMAIYMVCNILLFFHNSPFELTFWITYVHYTLTVVLIIYSSSYMWERMDVPSCGYILDLYVLETQLVGLIYVTPTL